MTGPIFDEARAIILARIEQAEDEARACTDELLTVISADEAIAIAADIAGCRRKADRLRAAFAVLATPTAAKVTP